MVDHAELPQITRTLTRCAAEISTLAALMSPTRSCTEVLEVLAHESARLYRIYPESPSAEQFMSQVCELQRVWSCTLADAIADEVRG